MDAEKDRTVGAEDSAADRELKEIDQQIAICDDGAAGQIIPVESITAAELDKLEIPPIVWLVEEFLPAGLAMISAPPKYYKSYMCLDLCVSVCTGVPFLGHPTHKHDCLYLDLESTKRRPQTRLNQICGDDAAKPDNLYIITADQNVGLIDRGFQAQMLYQLKEHPEIKLIVVDVFQRIRGAAGMKQGGYEKDYDDLGKLKKLADDHGLCILLVHHNRKQKDPSDPFNEIAGSAGVMGALDCAWAITKEERDDDEATLHITGRDLEGGEYTIRYDKDTFRWGYLGTTDDFQKELERFKYLHSALTKTIMRLVDSSGGHWEGTAADIISASKYFGHTIHDTSQQVGRKIFEYEKLLEFDNIKHKYDQSHRKRLHIFDKVVVGDVVDVVDDVDVADDDAT